jgi:hypothetical protein
MSRNEVLEHALAYTSLGWFVLPLTPKDKTPFTRLAPRGFKSASNDPRQALEWFGKRPHLNIGIACAMSGLVVFDVDFRNGGTIEDLNSTLIVKTGNGFHYYYEHTEGFKYPGKLRNGVDIKFNGYVVAAPSIHPSGAKYERFSELLPQRFAS